MTITWSDVGGNPAPGDPDGIVAKAKTFGTIADNADRCRHDLLALRQGNAHVWQGEAAEAFQSQLDQASSLPDDLAKLTESYRTVEDVLGSYGRALRNLQEDARQALREVQHYTPVKERCDARYQAARSERQSKERDVDSWGTYLSDLRSLMRDPAYANRSDPANATWAADLDRRYGSARHSEEQARQELARSQSAEQTATGDLRDARKKLGAARNEIERVRNQRNAVVQGTVDGIELAGERGIKNKHWLVKGFEAAFDWITTLENLHQVLDAIGVALAIAGVVLLIVASGGAALPIVLGLAAAVAVTKLGVGLALLSQGRADWGDLAWDAFDVVMSVTALKALVGPTGQILKAHSGVAGVVQRLAQKVVRFTNGSTIGKLFGAVGGFKSKIFRSIHKVPFIGQKVFSMSSKIRAYMQTHAMFGRMFNPQALASYNVIPDTAELIFDAVTDHDDIEGFVKGTFSAGRDAIDAVHRFVTPAEMEQRYPGCYSYPGGGSW